MSGVFYSEKTKLVNVSSMYDVVHCSSLNKMNIYFWGIFTLPLTKKMNLLFVSTLTIYPCGCFVSVFCLLLADSIQRQIR